jgi:hypothetical protein
VADGVRASEDDVKPAIRELPLDPLDREPERDELVMTDDAVLIRCDLRKIPNWSSFGSTIEPNLDQFAVSRGWHVPLSAVGS